MVWPPGMESLLSNCQYMEHYAGGSVDGSKLGPILCIIVERLGNILEGGNGGSGEPLFVDA